MARPHLLVLSAASALAACSSTSDTVRVEPTIVQVVVDGEVGSPEAPLDFSGETITRSISVQTLDKDGQPYPFDGDLTVRVRPGKLDQNSQAKLSPSTNRRWLGSTSRMACAARRWTVFNPSQL